MSHVTNQTLRYGIFKDIFEPCLWPQMVTLQQVNGSRTDARRIQQSFSPDDVN